MSRLKQYFKNKYNVLFLLILTLGFFLRIYKFEELFMYGHDQDLAGWIIKDITVDKHLRLIGQETSTQGIFIGPLFYYLLIPFYFIFGMDPVGGVFLVLLIGLFSIFSFYFVFSEIFSKKVGLIAALLYSASFYTVVMDREVAPTMPVVLWTVWFLWGLNQISKGRQKFAYIYLGFLFALTWHLNVALVLLIPLVAAAQLLTKKKFEWKNIIWGLATLVFFSLPFILFELRHDFAQINYLIAAFSKDQYDIVSGTDKFLRTIDLLSKNLRNFLYGDFPNIDSFFALLAFLSAFLFVFYKKLFPGKYGIIFLLWMVIYVAFFSLYSKRLSEYYLNGSVIVWITVFSISISYFLQKKYLKYAGVLLLATFTLINISRFLNQPVNRSGYLYKKSLVAEIKQDMLKNNYPCVSISYITEPGYNLGYRYFIWHKEIKTKPISKEVPVYTIVYPQKPIFKTGKDFGAIGLIYPDYGSYNEVTIDKACEGQDFNVIDSMLGYN